MKWAVSKEELSKPLQMSLDKIYDKEGQRLIEGWATVEIRDKDGEILPISEFKKIMPIIMSKGGNLVVQHTNQTAGKILNYSFETHPQLKKEGMKILAEINAKTKSDDNIWDDIKSGKTNAFSFGGMAWDKDAVMDENGLSYKLKDMEGFEVSVVQKPANPGAYFTEVNFFAKSDVQKPFAGYENFESCVKQNSDKENPDAYCASVMHAVEKINDDNTFEKMKKEARDPSAVCGQIWFNGTEEQRSGFSGGTQGRGRDEKPPEDWWDDCTGKIKGVMLNSQGSDNLIKDFFKAKIMETKQDPAPPVDAQPAPQPSDVEARVSKLESQMTEALKILAAAAPTNKPEDKPDEEEDDDQEEMMKVFKSELGKAKDDILKALHVTTSDTPRPATIDISKGQAQTLPEKLTGASIIEKAEKGEIVGMADLKAQKEADLREALKNAGVSI